MRYFEKNPQTLLLVNPTKAKRSKKARKAKKPSLSPSARKAKFTKLAKSADAKVNKVTKAAKASATKAKKDEIAKAKVAKAQVEKLKKQLKTEKAAVVVAKQQASAAKKEAAKMARGLRNPPPKRGKAVRKKRALPKATRREAAAAKRRVKKREAGLVRRGRKVATRAKAATRREETTAAQLAARRKRFMDSKKVASNAKYLGMSKSDAWDTYGAAGELQKAATKARKASRGEISPAKQERAWTPRRQAIVARIKAAGGPSISKYEAVSVPMGDLYDIAKEFEAPVKAGKKAAVAKRKSARQLAQKKRLERKRTGLPRGTKLSDLPALGYTMPAPPLRPPVSAVIDQSSKQLVDPWNWRPEIQGKQSPGWYWSPSKEGKFRLVKNPTKKRRKKAKKVGALTKYGRKIPLIGKPLFGPHRKSKKGKKNPDFSLVEVAKITAAGGVGYVGGGMVDGLATGMVSSFIPQSRIASAVGGAFTVGLAHFLTRNSAYYVPVMAGAGIAAIKGVMQSDTLDEEGNGGGGGFISTIKETVGGFRDKAAEGMGFMPTDDELMASINADVLNEYVSASPMDSLRDDGMDEYVEISPMGDDGMDEYVEVSPMGDDGMDEYVEVSPMGDDGDDGMDEYVEIPLEEDIDVSSSDDDELEDYDDYDSVDDYDDFDDAFDEDDEGDVDEMAGDYSAAIADVPYGELHPQEAVNMGSYEELADEDDDFDDEDDDFDDEDDDDFDDEDDDFDDEDDDDFDDDEGMDEYEELAAYEELAGEYAALADEYEAAAQLGATSRGRKRQLRRRRRVARRSARKVARRSGVGQRSRILSRRRRHLARGKSRRSWVSKLARAGSRPPKPSPRRRVRGKKQARSTARTFNRAVQRSIVQATEGTQFPTGSKSHFRAAFNKFSRSIGGAVPTGMRKAFLVSYRGKTKGEAAAMKAARISGVPKEAAQLIGSAAASESMHEVVEQGGPAGIVHQGGTVTRRIRRQPRTRRVRRAGENVQEFGGIFRNSIFGRRGRWRS